MNKSELIEAIADKADLTKAGATRALDAMLDTINDALVKGDQVVLLGFGTFSVKDRAARQGRNPQTGETIDIKATRAATFKPGKALKDAVNEDIPAAPAAAAASPSAHHAESALEVV